MIIKELPYSDRPREKAIKYGFEKISNSEYEEKYLNLLKLFFENKRN